MVAHLRNSVNLKQWVLDVCKKWPMNAEAEDVSVHCTIKTQKAPDSLASFQ